jgi:Ca2+-binding RTX toxin-like protein
LKVYYEDGSWEVLNQAVGGDYLLSFDLDTTKVVDYVELSSADTQFKITGVSLSYVTKVFPDDYELSFELTGTDADQDAAVAEFTVAVNTSSGGDYQIEGTAGDDWVHGTSGNDVLIGGAGNDVLIGGEGDDVFQFTLADADTAGGGGYTDVIKDFSLGNNVLDIGDLLSQEGSDVTALVDGGNTTLTFTNSGGAVIQTIVLEGYVADTSGVNSIIDALKGDGTYNA